MSDLVNTTGGITRLNTHNYQSWRSRIKSYLEGQDLWEVVNGNDTKPPQNAEKFKIWKVKAAKAMYVLKSTVEDWLLRRIGDDDTPNMAWDTFESLFSKANDARLQYGIGDTGIRPVEMDTARMIDPELYKAAKKGDASCFSVIHRRNMTEEEAMNNQRGNFLKRTQYGNNNILHIAARAGRDNFVAEVLCRFPLLSDQVNSQGDTPLLVAARFGHLKVVKELTKSAAENGTNSSSISRQIGTAPAAESGTNSSSAEEDIVDHPLEAGNVPVSHHRREVGEGIVDHQLEQGTRPDSIIINMEDVINSGDMATATEEGPVHLQLDGLIPYQWRVTNLEQGTTVTTALHEALRNGHQDVARYLLGLNPGMAVLDNLAGESPLFLAAESGCEIFMLDVLLSNQPYSTNGPNGQNALHAARYCCDAIISALIKQNPVLMRKLDDHGKAAVHYAVEGEYWGFLDLMLEADPSLALFPDSDGFTPLLRAASRGSEMACKEILKICPESIEARNHKGQNTLHLSKFRGFFHGLQFLRIPEILELRNVGDHEGNTPLHLAIKQNHKVKAMVLTLSAPVDLGAVNNDGLTALDLCGSDTKLYRKRIMSWFLKLNLSPRGRRPNDPEEFFQTFIIADVDADFKPFMKTIILVAALIATVTFAAAFTMPGGFDTSSDNLGVATLVKKVALKVFILSDTFAMCCSITVVLLLSIAMLAEGDIVPSIAANSMMFLYLAFFATLVAFMSGIFVVIAPKALWVAISVCIVCSAAPFLIQPWKLPGDPSISLLHPAIFYRLCQGLKQKTKQRNKRKSEQRYVRSLIQRTPDTTYRVSNTNTVAN